MIGPIQYEPRPSERGAPPTAPSFTGAAVDWLRGLVGVFAFGLLLLLLFPGVVSGVSRTLRSRPWPSLGMGFGLVLGTPIAALLVFAVGLLVGGWWLALLLLPAYVIALLAGYALGAAAVGQWLFARLGREAWHPVWSLLVGLVLLGVLGLVPVLGGLLVALVLTAGLGAGALVVAQAYRDARTVTPQPQAGPLAVSVVPATTPA